jgi:hypothetical protein
MPKPILSVLKSTRLLILLLLAAVAVRADVVCRSPGGIAGFGAEYKEAELYIRPDTRSLRDMDVFVTVRQDILYLHSNYVTRGFDVATKIATESAEFDLLTLVINLVNSEKQTVISRETLASQLGSVRFFVSADFFRARKFDPLNVEDAAQLFVIDDGGVVRPTLLIPDNSGRQRVVMEFQPSLYKKVDDPSANINNRYGARQFVRNDVRLLLLSVDSTTEALVKEKIPAANTISFDMTSKESLERSLSTHRNKTVFPLGHIEGDAFVVRDAGNKVLFEIPLTELNDIAKKYNVTMFALGCNSAQATRTAGVLNTFNTVDAVNRFATAMSSSATYMDFFHKLAADEVFILLDDSLGGDPEWLKMQIYSGGVSGGDGGGAGGGGGGGGRGSGSGKGRGAPVRPRPVGTITILNPPAPPTPLVYGPGSSSPSPTPVFSGTSGSSSYNRQPSYIADEQQDDSSWWIILVVIGVGVAGVVWGLLRLAKNAYYT